MIFWLLRTHHEGFLGKDNAALFKKFRQENEDFGCVTISEKYESSEFCFIKAEDYNGLQHRMELYNELLTAKIKESDKILVTKNSVDDSEFGKLDKTDIFLYINGKYRHCYQVYKPNEENSEDVDARNITRAIQHRNESKNNGNNKERSI